MLVALDAVRVVSAFVQAVGTLDHVSRSDLGFATCEVSEKDLLRLTFFARETKVPLSGGKSGHSYILVLELESVFGAMRNGAYQWFTYKLNVRRASRSFCRSAAADRHDPLN
jgi:hypothetical protein